ncbi:MAG: hypothetical protein MHPSP_002086 [Paramarteilia canceri]
MIKQAKGELHYIRIYYKCLLNTVDPELCETFDNRDSENSFKNHGLRERFNLTKHPIFAMNWLVPLYFIKLRFVYTIYDFFRNDSQFISENTLESILKSFDSLTPQLAQGIAMMKFCEKFGFELTSRNEVLFDDFRDLAKMPLNKSSKEENANDLNKKSAKKKKKGLFNRTKNNKSDTNDQNRQSQQYVPIQDTKINNEKYYRDSRATSIMIERDYSDNKSNFDEERSSSDENDQLYPNSLSSESDDKYPLNKTGDDLSNEDNISEIEGRKVGKMNSLLKSKQLKINVIISLEIYKQ